METAILKKAVACLEKALEKIAELEAQLAAATAGPAMTPQQKATAARQEKTLETWKPAIDAMIKVAVRCGAEGEKLRQQPVLNMLFNELDVPLTDSQMKFFRQCLPDEHIDRTGGERGKG